MDKREVTIFDELEKEIFKTFEEQETEKDKKYFVNEIFRLINVICYRNGWVENVETHDKNLKNIQIN